MQEAARQTRIWAVKYFFLNSEVLAIINQYLKIEYGILRRPEAVLETIINSTSCADGNEDNIWSKGSYKID